MTQTTITRSAFFFPFVSYLLDESLVQISFLPILLVPLSSPCNRTIYPNLSHHHLSLLSTSFLLPPVLLIPFQFLSSLCHPFLSFPIDNKFSSAALLYDKAIYQMKISRLYTLKLSFHLHSHCLLIFPVISSPNDLGYFIADNMYYYCNPKIDVQGAYRELLIIPAYGYDPKYYYHKICVSTVYYYQLIL